ncbi:MAG: hypothetical protein JNM85_07865 [Chthonomonas sp.]|nr:hypothetical protein [Chthonomonas sp.]
MSEKYDQLIQEATQALGEHRFEDALRAADGALTESQKSSQAHTIRGIALAQLGRSAEATGAFQVAVNADLQNAKARYNFATHLYQQGDRDSAYSLAREALQIDSGMNSAQDLMRLIDEERRAAAHSQPAMAPPPGVPYGGMAAPPQSMPRAGYESRSVHTLPFLTKNAGLWTAAGWLLVLLSACVFAYSVTVLLPYFSELMANAQNQDKTKELSERMSSVMPGWVSLLSLFLTIGTIFWTIMDLVDRRGNFIWLVPSILCTICGMQWMVLPIYMVTARKSN